MKQLGYGDTTMGYKQKYEDERRAFEKFRNNSVLIKSDFTFDKDRWDLVDLPGSFNLKLRSA